MSKLLFCSFSIIVLVLSREKSNTGSRWCTNAFKSFKQPLHATHLLRATGVELQYGFLKKFSTHKNGLRAENGIIKKRRNLNQISFFFSEVKRKTRQEVLLNKENPIKKHILLELYNYHHSEMFKSMRLNINSILHSKKKNCLFVMVV